MPITPPAGYSRVHRFARWTTGIANSQDLKAIYGNSFGYTAAKKKVAGASTTALLNAGVTGTAPVTLATTNPDVPRRLTVTIGGTTANILDAGIVVSGFNIEGKPMSESFQVAQGTGATINGSKAFAVVSSVFVPGMSGTGVTVSVGTQNALGTYHRLFPNNTTVKVYSSTAIATNPTLQGVPTVIANGGNIELNAVTPATAPDGTTFLYICYSFDYWQSPPGSQNDGTFGAGDFLYSSSTSTSTSSTSTSTTTFGTTTSTSSTSVSTSSTSVSTSSTSTSTSSTSTSTTTTP